MNAASNTPMKCILDDFSQICNNCSTCNSLYYSLFFPREISTRRPVSIISRNSSCYISTENSNIQFCKKKKVRLPNNGSDPWQLSLNADVKNCSGRCTAENSTHPYIPLKKNVARFSLSFRFS